VQAIDPNNHMAVTFSDALGRTRYVQEYSGLASLNSTTWAANVIQQKAAQ